MPWIIPVASAVIGGVQAANSAHKKNLAESELENQVKNFQPNQSIMDFYGKALAKYNPNPYNSLGYQQQENQIKRNLATGLNNSQSKRLGLGALGGLVQQSNDSSAKAAANAEAQGGRDLSVLGQAAQMKTAEQQKKFDMQYNLTAMKAAANAQKENTGLQNVWGGLNTAASLVGEYGWDGKKDGSGTNKWDNGWNAGGNAYKMPRLRATF